MARSQRGHVFYPFNLWIEVDRMHLLFLKARIRWLFSFIWFCSLAILYLPLSHNVFCLVFLDALVFGFYVVPAEIVVFLFLILVANHCCCLLGHLSRFRSLLHWFHCNKPQKPKESTIIVKITLLICWDISVNIFQQ